MTYATVDGYQVSYELIGDSGPLWAITPGGRYSKDTPGIRELGQALTANGGRALIWDRPNTGASDLNFTGDTESEMQAAALAGIIRQLDAGPAIIVGGSGGSRVSTLCAAQHRDVAKGLAAWWISGGVYGLMSLGVYYAGGSFQAAWEGGMEAVAALPEWQEPIERNPSNRERILSQDPQTFMQTMERWMNAYCPREGELIPGVLDSELMKLDIPALVFRSGASDISHRRETSEKLAELLPNSRLVEPPWADTEWADRHTPEAQKEGLFFHWPLLAPQLLEWASETGLI